MEAQKRLLDIENKMSAQSNAAKEQENRVRDLELKSKAE
jgi:hypothetical protein